MLVINSEGEKIIVKNQVENPKKNEVETIDEVPVKVDNAEAKAREFKEQNNIIIDGKPKRTTAESQLLFTKLIAGFMALIVIILLVVVLIALPKTMQVINQAEQTIADVDKTVGEATDVIEDIKTAVNEATDAIEKIDIDGINQSIDSLNTVSSSIANIFSVLK